MLWQAKTLRLGNPETIRVFPRTLLPDTVSMFAGIEGMAVAET
jgi:hypothetical protein